jgi:hypothetical protein
MIERSLELVVTRHDIEDIREDDRIGLLKSIIMIKQNLYKEGVRSGVYQETTTSPLEEGVHHSFLGNGFIFSCSPIPHVQSLWFLAAHHEAGWSRTSLFGTWACLCLPTIARARCKTAQEIELLRPVLTSEIFNLD